MSQAPSQAPSEAPRDAPPDRPAADGALDAVVLRLQDYREADRLVWLLTAERGRVSAVARAARRCQKRFGGHLDLFQRVRARVTRSKGSLHALQECRVVAAWPRVRADVERYAAASFAAELAIALSREEAEDAPLFDAVVAAFSRLDDPTTPVTAASVAAIAVHLLTTSGFLVDLATCGACDGSLADPDAGGAWIEPGGRVRCGRCVPPGSQDEAPPDAGRGAGRPSHAAPRHDGRRDGAAVGRRLTPSDAAALASWQRSSLADALGVPAGSAAVAAVRDLVREVAGHSLKSESFLWEIVR